VGKQKKDIEYFNKGLPSKNPLECETEYLQGLLDDREVESRIKVVVDRFKEESVSTWKVNKKFLVQNKPGIGRKELIYVYTLKRKPFFLHKVFRIDISGGSTRRGRPGKPEICFAVTPGRSGDVRHQEGTDELIKYFTDYLNRHLAYEKKTRLQKLGIY